MKWASTIAVVFLALALTGETFFLVKQTGDQQQLTSQAIGLEYQVEKLKDEKAALSKENDGLKGENTKLAKEIAILTEKAATFEKDTNALKAEKGKVTQELEVKTTKVNTLTNENSTLKKKYMCSDTLSYVDFSSNETVNASLKQYVNKSKNRSEPVSASYWNLIWTGKKYSTHTVEVHSEKDRMNYIWKFTVYFRGESYGDHESGVFYNDQQCWMYLDK